VRKLPIQQIGVVSFCPDITVSKPKALKKESSSKLVLSETFLAGANQGSSEIHALQRNPENATRRGRSSARLSFVRSLSFVIVLFSALASFAAASFQQLPFTDPFPPSANGAATTFVQPASTVILNENVAGVGLPFTRALPSGWQSGMGAITVEWWMKQKPWNNDPIRDNPDGVIVHGPGFFITADWLFGDGPGSILCLFSQTKGGAFVGARPIPIANDISDQQWHHFAVTYDLRWVRIYRDGELIDQKWLDNNTDRLGPVEDDSGNIATSVIEVGGGGVTSGRRFQNGWLDCVRVSNVALTPWQVRRNFENSRRYTKTLYVAAGASDSAAGTQASPTSLRTALSQVGANTRIILQPGTYSGADFQINRAALSPRDHCLITGADGAAPAIIAGGTPTLSGANHVTLRNLTFSSDNGDALTVNNSTGVTVDACRLSGSQRGLVANNAPKIAVQNCVVNVNGVGLQLGGSSNNRLRNNTVVNGTVGIQLDAGSSSASVLNNLLSGQSSASLVVNNGAQQWYRGNGNLYNPASGTAVVLLGTSFSTAQVRDKSLAQAWYTYDKADKADPNSRRTGYSAEAQSMAFTPVFVNAAAGDFRLAAVLGNAMDAGAERTFQRGVISPAADALGTPRPQGNGYDVGAFEAVGAAYSVFNLNADYTTSAGVYKPDGTLIRTLFSGRRMAAGTNVVFWNGLTDNTEVAPNDTYTIKMIAHNVQYVWENVVGNSSVPNHGESVHNGFEPIKAMTFNGTTAFYTSGYNENHLELNRFHTSNPNKLTKIFGPKTLITTDSITDVAADGANLFAMNSVSVAVYSQSSLGVTRTIGTGGGNKNVEVQKNGNLLFVSKKSQNTISIYDKNSGAQTGSIAVNQPGDLSVTASGDLWVVTGNSVVRYAVNSGGGTVVQTIGGFGNPIAVACSPVDGTVLVADASTWQIKAFDSAGTPIWTHGQAGGFANGPRVTSDKFYWAYVDQGKTHIETFLQFQPDGTWWVGDTFLSRSMHFDMNRQLLHEICFQPHTYMATADVNNPSRVFNRFTEYHVDYTKPPQEGWKITNFWGYGLPSYAYHAGMEDGFCSAITMSNGRTYTMMFDGGAGQTRVIVELTASGVRETSSRGHSSYTRIHKDGTIYGNSTGNPQTYWRKRFTGFNAAGDPQWGAAEQIASAPIASGFLRDDPKSERFPLQTTNGTVVVFDPSRRTGYHLGGVKPGGNQWLWKAMPSLGGHDGQGSADTWVEYGGNYHMVCGRSVFAGFHGEFYQDAGQSGQFFHYFDNGLFVGQFGQPLLFGVVVNPPGGSGNQLNPVLVERGTEAFIYHNDEPGRGSHRWRMAGMDTIRELASNVTVGQAPIGTTNNPSSGISTNTIGGGGSTNSTPSGPDLVVTSVSMTPSNPTVGDLVRFHATIENQGSAPTPAGATIGLGFYVNGVVQGWWFTSTAGLAPGESQNVTSNDGPNGGLWTAASGTHTLVAHLDDVNRISEAVETNNTRSLTFTTGNGGTTVNPSDLEVTAVAATPANPSPGQPVVFSAQVKNRGTTATPSGTPVGVGFYVNGGSITSWVSTASIAAGQTVTLTANTGPTGSPYWNAVGGTNTILAIADDVTRIGLNVLTNNTKTMKLVVRSNTSTNTNSNPAVPIVKMARANGKVTLTWNAQVGQQYQVQFRSAMTSAWQPLGAVVTATNATASYTDIPPATSKMRFYNVQRK
jgi:hypothetical protein